MEKFPQILAILGNMITDIAEIIEEKPVKAKRKYTRKKKVPEEIVYED